MKKNLFIGIALLLSAITSCTKDEMKEVVEANTVTTKAEITDIMTIETDTVGQLEDKIGDRAYTVQKLILSGPINAADVEIIRNLPELVSIDMKHVTLKGGDETYTVYVDNNPQNCRLYDNEIGQRMFCNTKLSEIILPDSITKIGAYAFHSLRGSAEYPFTEITIPDRVEVIEHEAFVRCNYLTKVVLPASLQVIDTYTFQECANLTTVEIKEKVTSIGYHAFYQCPSLQSITLPDSLERLEGDCFSYSGLTSITLPDKVTYIGSNAFDNCTQLQSVTMPEGLTSIGGYTFRGCAALTSIILPKSLQTIGGYAFQDCKSLPKISLPETIQNINNNSFEGCESLSYLEIPESIRRIEGYAFNNCKGLKTVIFHNSLNNCGISHNVFSNSGLESIILTDNVKSIGSNCFENCTSLTSVTLSNALTTLSSRTFYKCSALESITIPNSVITIGDDCFLECSSLSSVELPQLLETINGSAFRNCTNLKELNFTETTNLKEISGSAFSESGLVNVTLPESVETIGSYAFSGCSDLESITIPAGVTSINYGIFERTERLTSVFWNTSAAIPDYYNSNPNCLFYVNAADVQIGSGINNVIVNGTSESITLDASDRFFVSQEFKAKKVTFTRYFSETTYFGRASGWKSIVLPFNVTSITHSDGRVLAPFNANVTDAKPFWLRRLTATGFENVTQIEADIPYIIAMPNNSNYDSEYNISGNVTFSAEDPNGITIPVTGDMVQDAGPSFVLHANYETIPMADNIYVLNETSSDERPYGSVFVRNERDARPFEGYVTPLSTAANAPAFFSLDAGRPATRSAKPLGPVPSIDDM